MRRKGFTLIELLVVIAIIALLVSILLPSLNRAREGARKAVCSTRLKGMGTAFETYRNDYKRFPVLSNVSGGTVTYPTTVDNDPPSPASDIDDFWATSYAQCNLNSMYLLIHHAYCDADQFRCPSDGDYIEFDPNGDDAGFNQWNNSSYAFQPFTRGTDANPNNAYPGAPSQDGGTIIAGDRPNTGGSDLKASGNHTGGSYLTMNNAVNFINQEEPTFGYNSNNVYEVDMDADGDVTSQSGLPVYASDTYLVWKSGS